MDEIKQYVQQVKERCMKFKQKEDFDYNAMVELFEEYLTEGKNNLNLKQAKKRLKDLLVETTVKDEEDKQRRLRMVIGIYYLTDFKFDNPNSLKAIREICKDSQLSVPEYLKEIVKIVVEAENKGSQK